MKPSKTHQPVQERSIETRNKILAAAKKLFSEKGYYKTNSKEIAKEAGVAIGTFYIYFNDKKPLFLEIFRSFYQDISETVFTADVGALLEERDGKKIVRVLIRKLLEAHAFSPEFHRESIAMVHSDNDVKEINDEEEEKTVQRLVQLFSAHRAMLRVTDLEAAARIVLRSADEVIHGIHIRRFPMEKARLITGLEDMIYRFLFRD